MNLKRTNKLLALLLAVLMVVSLLPTMAMAAGYGITVIKADDRFNAEFDISLYDSVDTDDGWGDWNELSVNYNEKTVIPSESFEIDIILESYDSDNWVFSGWKINNTLIDTTTELGNTEYLTDVGEDWNLASGVYLPYTGMGSWNGKSLLTLYGIILADIEIEPVFEAKNAIAFTPTVEIAADQTDCGTISSLDYVNGDETYSKWKLTAVPAAGYQLAYLLENGTENKVYSEDGTTVTWNVTAAGAWTAFFEPAVIHFNSVNFGLTPGGLSTGVGSGAVFAGQRAGCAASFFVPSAVAESEFRYTLYAGEGTEGTKLAEYSKTMSYSGGNEGINLMVDPLPADLTKVTLAAQIGEGTPATRTLDVTVLPAGTEDLTYLDVPGSGSAPGTAGDVGPAVYDAASYIDPETGAMTLYLGTNDGVAYSDGGAFAKLGDLTGNIVALGTDATGNLTAVQVITPELNSQNDEYRVYRYIDGGWSTAEADPYLVSGAGNLQIGLVMGPDDVWIQNARWDGQSWGITMTFNSFWKADDTTAYAGSTNGVWVYKKGTDTLWSLVEGTSGTTYITGGRRTESGVELTVSDSYNPNGRVTGQNNVGSVWLVSISGSAASIDKLPVGGSYVGVGADGTLYAITAGRFYWEQTNTGYIGSYLYKYVDGAWQYQIVDAFNDPENEDDDPSTKYRPDGICYVVNPNENVTLFLGGAGAIYARYGDATITFNSHEGTAVEAITAPVFSAVTPPSSPTRDGYTFVGWYTMENLLDNCPTYTWGVMPAKDIELHAKWVEAGGGTDPLAEEREKALATLETYVDGLVQSDYSAEVWAQIQEAYNSGKSGIENAGSYDGIYAALNTAIETISGLAQTASGEITVAVSVDANTLGLGYLVEPTLVTVKKGTPASVVITDLLSEYAAEKYGVTNDGLIQKQPPLETMSTLYPWASSGSVLGGFYLSDIFFPEQTDYSIPETLQQFIQSADLGPVLDSDKDGKYLSEFDYVNTSGWMYSIGDKTSGGASFPGVGANGWMLSDGEVMRWQFTLLGYGADLGADNTQWGAESILDPGDKSALTWKIAEINAADEQEKYGDAYDEAMEVLTDAESTQAEVDAALRALKAIDNPGGGDTPTPGTTPTENKMPFVDVPEGAYFYDAVAWAVSSDPQITNGTSETTFSPNADCLREQIVTFLWRAAGKPAPTGTEMPFEDVAEGAYYYDAVLWACENGITLGVDETHFGVGQPCTREQVVTFLWRAANKPAATGTAAFSDVADDAYYAEAVKWAAEKEITLGVGDGKFGTGLTCTRGQIVTFLYRARETE